LEIGVLGSLKQEESTGDSGPKPELDWWAEVLFKRAMGLLTTRKTPYKDFI
jgi:hypothetical protein